LVLIGKEFTKPERVEHSDNITGGAHDSERTGGCFKPVIDLPEYPAGMSVETGDRAKVDLHGEELYLSAIFQT
jgi:hypothetical protein